ncbi:MAG TPA: acetyl-CoA carboxylase biotin carboxyl carrier protein subunit [Anaerolineae bacterium]|nr:acetyl-CoA carboxylase biotin carboxyl carrier protein subunit [Anaerolineae bacterium]HOR00849.1 acetyl-CoA carboxylase biotin carboxyl carrier protein subunit [Anaerolineae bacterium]HPL29289.1 acetyl-CoA carboxylase biotin carboxyl carrier protein subunit [Anaerolineae bacterium]
MAEHTEVTVNGTIYRVEIDSLDKLDGGPVEVRVNGRPYTVQLAQPGAPQESAAPAPAKPKPQPAAHPPAMATAPSGGQQVTAPMPGKILSVAVSAGDQVQAKDTLCTLEAMKMEMNIAATVAGTVREVRAEVGANVVYGDLLFVIE